MTSRNFYPSLSLIVNGVSLSSRTKSHYKAVIPNQGAEAHKGAVRRC